MTDTVSRRLIDQRVRNRIMEAVELLACGDDGVRRAWIDEYFQRFYDQIPYRDDGEMHPNSAISADERIALIEVGFVLDAALDHTQNAETADELIATGWPGRVQPVAVKA